MNRVNELTPFGAGFRVIISDDERKLLGMLENATSFRVTDVIRGSAAEFDFTVRGLNASLMAFTARIDLWAIKELVDWTSGRVAALTDYPEMARAGDWSGVRDSSDRKIRVIFEGYVMPLLSTAPVPGLTG